MLPIPSWQRQTRVGPEARSAIDWAEDPLADRFTVFDRRSDCTARRVPKLDPHKGVFDRRLAGYRELSAVRLFGEVRAAGYPGGLRPGRAAGWTEA